MTFLTLCELFGCILSVSSELVKPASFLLRKFVEVD